MKQLSLYFLTVIVFLSTSCRKVDGDGPVVTETRHVTNFAGVDLRCSAEVTYRQGNDYKVEVSAQENILRILKTYSSNNRLVVRFENDVRVKSAEPVRIEVTAPVASGFRISGSGDIRTFGAFTPSRLELDISGSGSMTVNQVTADEIDANISGSGDITVVDGSATEVRTRISGSGNIDLLDIPASRGTTTTSGSGNTLVNTSERLDVTISGSGSVFYRGNPIISTRISGSGKVQPR